MAVASVVPARSADTPVGITLSEFIRFEGAAGNRRIRVVEEIRTQGDWDKMKDFNLPLRTKIRGFIGGGDLTAENLRTFADNVEDEKKRRRYRKHATGVWRIPAPASADAGRNRPEGDVERWSAPREAGSGSRVSDR